MTKKLHISLFARLLSIAVLLLSFASANAQEISAHAATPHKTYIIGDKIAYAIHIKHPSDYTATWPDSIMLPGGLELIDSAMSSYRKGNETHQNIVFSLIGFEPGRYVFPSVDINFSKGTSSFMLSTDTIGFNLNIAEVDSAGDIKPIAGPVEVPYTFSEILPYIIGGLVFLGGLALLVYYIRNKKKEPQTKPEEPGLSPWEMAMQKLQELHDERHVLSGEHKLFYSRLSIIIREYLFDAFGIDAMELTTSDIIYICKNKLILQDCNSLLGELLKQADLVKFAKFKPDGDDMRRALDMAIVFIEKARDEERKPAAPAALS